MKKKTEKKTSDDSEKVQEVTVQRRFDTKEARYDAFCMSYVQHWNAAQAAREVGYSPKSARRQGNRLLIQGHFCVIYAEDIHP